jgi:hypothetical protein
MNLNPAGLVRSNVPSSWEEVTHPQCLKLGGGLPSGFAMRAISEEGIGGVT